MAGLNRRLRFAAVVLPLLVLAMAGWARGATITVINTNDSGAGSLRAAITSANTTPTIASTINFSVSGTITLGSTLPAIANTSPGSLTIDGSGQAITISGGGTVKVMTVNSGAALTLQNLTIADGSTGNSLVENGAGIDNAGTLTVINSAFSGNTSTVAQGGGIANESGGTLTVTNCTFSGNTAGAGAGIFNDGTATVTKSTFSGNLTGFGGGGILNTGTLTVTNSTFSGNTAGEGGGIASIVATLTVLNSTFSGNTAFGPAGGGAISDSGGLTVTNCTLSGNSATGDGDFGGGGISNGGALTVTNSTFSDNSASFKPGGGISNHSGGTLTVTNSTFSGNSADHADGGGIDNAFGLTLRVTNCSFSGNSAPNGTGGGINNVSGSATLKGTILANETSGGNCAGTSAPPVSDAGYNISDDGTCGFGATSINNSTTLNLDPAGLQNNGGPTQTIALEPNSQAVDFIPVAMCTVTTDQRGFPRPDSGNLNFCDAGAFELQTERLTVVPGSEKTQIARSTSSSDSDQVNMAFTFIDHGSPILDDPPSIVGPHCDDGTDALNGIDVDLFEGTCADLATVTGGLLLDLSPFVVRTVNGHSYGTLFQKSPTVPSPETVSVRIVQLSTPEDTCGEWTLNIQVAGLDTGASGLGGGNPFALVIEDGNKNEGCFDIDNAIVGSQIPPPTRKVRRGVRR